MIANENLKPISKDLKNSPNQKDRNQLSYDLFDFEGSPPIPTQ